MNDTHGVAGEPWYGFDLDGTLAFYDKWRGINHIGKPIKPMVDLIKKMHAEGKRVKILTARAYPRSVPETKPNPHCGKAALPKYVDRLLSRVSPVVVETFRGALDDRYHREEWSATEFVFDWCAKHLGFIPEVTYEKDYLMLELYDDRVKQVIPNTGILVEDLLTK